MLQTIFGRTFLDSTLEHFRRDAGFQSGQYLGPRSRVNSVPNLRLAAASGSLFMALCVIVVGMNLHGEFFVRENKFYEERKRRVTGADFRSSPRRGQSGPHVAKFLPRERAGCEAALDRKSV